MLGNLERSLLQKIYAENMVFLLSNNGVLKWFNDNARPVLGVFPDSTIDLKDLVTTLSDYSKSQNLKLSLSVEHIDQHYALIFSTATPPSVINTQIVNKIKSTLLNHSDLKNILRLISSFLKNNMSLDLCLSLKQLDLADELIIYTTSKEQALIGQTTAQPAFNKAYPNRRIITKFNLPIGSIFYSIDLDDEQTRIADFLIKQSINQVISNNLPALEQFESTDELITQHQAAISVVVDEFGKIIDFRSGSLLIGEKDDVMAFPFLSLLSKQSIRSCTSKNIKKFGIKRQSEFQNLVMEADVIGVDSINVKTSGIGLPIFKARAQIVKAGHDRYLVQFKPVDEFAKKAPEISAESEAIAFLRMLNTPIVLLKKHKQQVNFLLASASFNTLFEFHENQNFHLFSVVRKITKGEFKLFKATWYAAVASDQSFIWTGSITINGVQKWIEVGCASPKNFYAGKPTYFFINDVSKHVHQAVTINQLNSKIKLANRGAGIGIWSYNYQDGITYWDDTMYSLLGVAKSEHETTDKIQVLKSLLHKDDIEGTFKKLKSTIDKKAELTYQNRIVDHDDKVKWIQTTGSYHYNYQTAEESFFGASWDITEIKEAQLRAEKTSLERGRFLANMSHEIKTPLHGLIAALEHFNEFNLSHKQLEYSDIAYECANTTLALVEDILLYTKITSDTPIVHKERVNFTQILEQKLQTLLPFAKSTQNKLIFEYGCKMPSYLNIDRQKIILLIRILVTNALKFTHKGFVRAIFHFDYSTSTLEITVKDNGIGIEQDLLTVMFEPFVQGDLTSTKLFSGAGLGLPIAKELVQALDGTIEVKSTPRKGSTFKIQLPATAFDTPTPPINEIYSVAVVSDDGNLDIELDCCELTRLDQLEKLSSNKLDRVDLVIFDTEYTHFQDAKILKFAKKAPCNVAYISDYPISGSEALSNLMQLSTIAKCRAIEIKDILFTAPPIQKKPEQSASETKPVKKANSLPAAITSQEQQKPDSSIQPPPERDTLSVILIVEDNPVNQLLAKAILQKHYTNTLVAENGQIALDMLAKQHVDLILMDCQMPVMDGIAATIAIRTKMHNTDVPILALTANAFDDDKQKCLNAGMNDFIAKPVDGVSLLEKIEFWLNNKKPKLKTKTMQ